MDVSSAFVELVPRETCGNASLGRFSRNTNESPAFERRTIMRSIIIVYRCTVHRAPIVENRSGHRRQSCVDFVCAAYPHNRLVVANSVFSFLTSLQSRPRDFLYSPSSPQFRD